MQISHTFRGHGRWADEGRYAICEGTLRFYILSSPRASRNRWKIARWRDDGVFCVLWQFTFLWSTKNCEEGKKIQHKLTELMVIQRWSQWKWMCRRNRWTVMSVLLISGKQFSITNDIKTRSYVQVAVDEQKHESRKNLVAKNHFRLTPEPLTSVGFFSDNDTSQKSVKTFILCSNWNWMKKVRLVVRFKHFFQLKGERFHETFYYFLLFFFFVA